MSLVDMLGAPVDDPTGPEPALQHACRVPDYEALDPAPEPGRRGRWAMVLAATAALGVGVAAGWFGSGHLLSGRTPTDSDLTPMPAGIAGYAELYVTKHLTTPGSDTDGSDTGGPGTIWVNQSAAISGEQVDDHSWLVTVAVDSLELVEGTYVPAELQHFTVLTTSIGGEPTALGLPARVPLARSQDQSPALFSEPVPDDQGATAVTFVKEYLTGGENLSRYVAVPAGLPTFESAPYRDAVVTPLGANSMGMIRLSATATKNNGITHHLEYVLTMALADGVWVVADVDQAAG